MKTIYISMVFAAFILATNGCATKQPQSLAFKTEAVSAGGIKILSLRVLPDGNGMKVLGVVQRGVGYYGTVYRHLDLVVRGPNGEVLSEQAATFRPNPIPFSSRFGAGRASYDFKLQEAPPLHSMIRVTVDCTLLADCKLAKIEK